MDQTLGRIHGIGVSPGIAIGKAYVLERGQILIPTSTLSGEEQIEEECARFEKAVVKAENDLEAIKQRISPEFKEHSYLLDVQQMILREHLIYDEVMRLIRSERLNAQWALNVALATSRAMFDSIQDDYIRSRIADVEAVGERLHRNLAGQEHDTLNGIKERVIVVARDLSPADTAQLRVERTLGLVVDMGGRTSHTSIVARSLNIPCVVGAEQASRTVRTGDVIIVDGASGFVIVAPTEEEISYYYERQDALDSYLKEIARRAHLEARTQDGSRVLVEANIELLEEVVAAKDNGSEGIGLYRTEFFFMNRRDLPDEEQLFNHYRELAELMAPQWVTMRTLDLGADKLSAWYPHLKENNPALGLRSIRLCLLCKDLFKMQLRAILRASADTRNIRLMFPLISGVGELIEARGVLKEVQEELTLKRIPFNENIPLGVMVEVPSAVAVADLLAREVEFFSIGTNDLIQYSLAIDRVNEHVAYLYEPLHPAVLRLIKQTVDAGHKAGIKVCICGEMAGEPLYVPILLGLNLDSFSMNPQSIPRVKNLICRARVKDCRAFVKKALQMRTAREISEVLQDTVLKNFPEEFKYFDPSALTPKGVDYNRRRNL